MSRAQRYNLKQSRRLWRLNELPQPWVDTPPGSEAFVAITFSFQEERGLAADGMLGPKTLAALRQRLPGTAGGVLSLPPKPEPVPASIPEPVQQQPEAVLEIDTDTLKATRTGKRSKPPIAIVLHDSITRTAKGTHKVLENRKLSTHYIVDEGGQVYECADPATRTAYHASAWNKTSVGIDMVTLLSPKYLRKASKADDKRRKRLAKKDWSASPTGKVIDYTPEQKAALKLLVTHLCERFNIPFAAPSTLTGYGERLPDVDAKNYTGIIAHAQTSSKRWDGLLAVELLHQEGAL